MDMGLKPAPVPNPVSLSIIAIFLRLGFLTPKMGIIITSEGCFEK